MTGRPRKASSTQARERGPEIITQRAAADAQGLRNHKLMQTMTDLRYLCLEWECPHRAPSSPSPRRSRWGTLWKGETHGERVSLDRGRRTRRQDPLQQRAERESRFDHAMRVAAKQPATLAGTAHSQRPIEAQPTPFFAALHRQAGPPLASTMSACFIVCGSNPIQPEQPQTVNIYPKQPQ